MKALIFQGTLKKSNTLSHTVTLAEILSDKLDALGVTCEKIHLTDKNILPGVEHNMGKGDEWPKILKQFLGADIIIFATPIWWGNHSSLIQRVIERLDALDDERLESGKSRMAGKVAGIVITGADDGAEHITGVIANFCVLVGMTVPPFCSLSYLGDMEKKSKTDLKKMFEKEVGGKAENMAQNLKLFADFLKVNPVAVPS